MITSEWFPLRPHAIQSNLYRSKARFKAVVAGRSSGKTMLSRRYIVRMLPIIKPWADPIYFYALPTREQAKRIAWVKIKKLIPPEWLTRDSINESELKIVTKFGSTLYVLGMDKPQRAEGVQYDGGIVDESSDQKPGVFNRTLLPALSDRHGFCWRIGVPKRYGIGGKEFKDFYDRGLQGKGIDDDNPDLRIESFTWPSSDVIDPSIIKFARAELDPRDFAEQYNASWEQTNGLVFYAYDDVFNVDDTVCLRRDLPLTISMDFNVDPMAWVVCQRLENQQLQVLDEIWLRNVSTQDALNEVYKRYSSHTKGFEFFGDASARARKTAATSAAMSDYIQIANDQRFRGAKIVFPRSNPNITDRFASCNAMFCNAIGKRRCRIHPRCKMLRQDLLRRVYNEGSREPNDSGDIGHITDALGYLIHRAFPLKLVGDNSPAQVAITVA